MYEEAKRSVLKATTFRIVATSSGIGLIYILSGKLEFATSFAIGDFVSKVLLYYVHERLWNRIKFGKRSATVDTAMRKPMITADSKEPLSDLLEKMSLSDVGSIIVEDEGKAVGIVTEKDIVERAFKTGKTTSTTLAKEVMSTPLLTIEYNSTLIEAYNMMQNLKIRRLAVTSKGKVIGVVTIRRVLQAILDVEKS